MNNDKQEQRRSLFQIFLLALTSIFLILIILLLSALGANDYIIHVSITRISDGHITVKWEDPTIPESGTDDYKGQIVVYRQDGVTSPNTIVSSRFFVENQTELDSLCTFSVDTTHNDMPMDYKPFQYRLLAGSVTLFPKVGEYGCTEADLKRLQENDGWGTEEDIKKLSILLSPTGSQDFTLQWVWPYESGHDKQDTDLGKIGGVILVTFKITARNVGDFKD